MSTKDPKDKLTEYEELKLSEVRRRYEKGEFSKDIRWEKNEKET